MSSILPVKLSISSNHDLSHFSIIISSSTLAQIFYFPFKDLSVHLLNFPSNSSLALKLFKGETCQYESNTDLSALEESSEVSLKCKLTYKDLNETEKLTEVAKLDDLEIELKITRLDIEKNYFSMQFEEFNSINEKILQLSLRSVEKNKNKIEVKTIDPKIIDLIDYQNINPQQIKAIKWLIVGVNSKLKLFQVLAESLEETRIELEKEREKNQKMMKRFREACSGFIKTTKTLEDQIKNLQEENKNLKASNFIPKTEKTLEDFKLPETSELEQVSLKLSLPAPAALNQLSSNNSELCNQSSLSSLIQEHTSLISQYQSSIDSLTQTNISLSQENQVLSQENISLNSSVSSLNTQLSSLESQLLQFQSQSTYTLELESQLSKLESEISKLNETNSELQGKLISSTSDLQSLTQSLQSEKLQLIEANSKLNQELAQVKITLIDTEKKFLDIQSRTYDSTQESSISLTEITKQNLQLLQDSKDLCEVSNKLEKNMLNEYQIVVLSLMQISSQHLMLQRLMSKILVFVRDKEAEIIELRNIMGEIQKQKVTYVPIKGDFIDNQLANFLNSMAVPCEVPFTRLEPGIYLFGSKRVVLRVENIGIVIRVGGGFIKLEDYINNQSVFEVGRMKIKEAKEQEYKQRHSKPSSPVVTDIDRTSSPCITYAPRTSISTGIPMPKTVSSLLDKKSSIDLNLTAPDKKNFGESSIPIFCKRSSIDSAVNQDKKIFEAMGTDKRGSVDSNIPNAEERILFDIADSTKTVDELPQPERKSRLEMTRKAFLIRKNTTG